MKIYSRYNPEKVLYESAATTIKEAVEEAVANNVDLTSADLECAYLAGADFTNAKFTNANLANADLKDANLANADIRDANFTDAELSCVKFWGKGGETKIKIYQLDVFFKALGIVVED